MVLMVWRDTPIASGQIGLGYVFDGALHPDVVFHAPIP
jgi:hypothetical protein